MHESTTVEEGEGVDIYDSPWGKIFVGGVSLAIGFYCDSLFTSLETGAIESARINWIVALAYEWLGHDITVWGLFGIGGLSVLWGLKQLVTGRE